MEELLEKTGMRCPSLIARMDENGCVMDLWAGCILNTFRISRLVSRSLLLVLGFRLVSVTPLHYYEVDRQRRRGWNKYLIDQCPSFE
jgi:hypothetical protein